MVRLLSRDDVRQILTMQDAIDVVTRAHIALVHGEVVMPVRLTMRYDERPSELEAMPAAIHSLPALGMKVINYVGTNIDRACRRSARCRMSRPRIWSTRALQRDIGTAFTF